MAKKRFSAEQIIQLLGEVEIHTSEDKTISQTNIPLGPLKGGRSLKL